LAVAVGLVVALGACGSDPEVASEPPTSAGDSTITDAGSTSTAATSGTSVTTAGSGAPAKLAAGPVQVLSLGDSLTAGQGEEPERGFPQRIADALESKPGRNGSTSLNLGRSGWDSQQILDGGPGDRSQLTGALEFIEQAKGEGKVVLVTLLAGSNDLWYLYDPTPPTSAEDEQASLDRYRANVTKLVTALRSAGATVALGINDDQSKRPVAADPKIRENTFPDITDAEVARMSAQARKLATVTREIASANGCVVADFLDAPFFRDRALLADDGNHPNAKGYDAMAKIWLDALQPLL
jgi:lysophospholipase L1-like esterase